MKQQTRDKIKSLEEELKAHKGFEPPETCPICTRVREEIAELEKGGEEEK